jgi:hypothetical protein
MLAGVDQAQFERAVGGQGPGERGCFHHVWPGATRANEEGRMMNAEITNLKAETLKS